MLWALLAIPCAWLLVAVLLDRIGQRPTPRGPFDALVVPGCAVRPDGSPSAALYRRTQHAVRLWSDGLAPRIILTGGVGTHAPAEAQVAATIARQEGVPDGALLLEDRSTSTAENALFAAQLHADAANWSVLVVTDGYHCWRCAHLFGRHFARAAAVGSTPGRRLRIRGAIREVGSIAAMPMKSRLNV